MIQSPLTLESSLAEALDRLAHLLPGFEDRPGQRAMAEAWLGALERGGILAVEAPTGIGKSIAYLIPAILAGSRGSGPVLVSTHTKALQTQLLERDIDVARRASGISLRAAVLKGRGSYLCRRRARARLGQTTLFGSRGLDAEATARLARWIEETETGDVEELAEAGVLVPPALWAELASDALYCGSHCDAEQGCFAKRARREAQRADVLVVNHALLLSDPYLRANLLPVVGALIVDEAHHIERVAREHFGVSVGVADVDRLSVRTDRRTGVLRTLARTVRRGRASRLLEAIETAAHALDPVARNAAALAEDLERLFEGCAPTARLTRDHDLGSISPHALDGLLGALAALDRGLAAVVARAEGEDAGALRRGADAAVDELRAVSGAWLEMADGLHAVTRLEERETAFYVDRDGRGTPRLNRRPLRVGASLRAILFDAVPATLLTSATLRAGSDFGPVLSGVGIDRESAETVTLPSPFPIERQVCCAIADGPDPTDQEFVAYLASLVESVACTLRRNTLVLLTSYQMLEALATRLRALLAPRGIPVLAQAPGEAAAPLADAFRGGSGAVLLGAASFWEGVDFPGEALEVLIIARLPFPVPTDPLVAARAEALEQEGGDPFRELMLPEALLRFRQGVGRLIRSAADRGSIVVADSRVLRAGYGASFRRVLPGVPIIERGPDAIAERLASWFDGEAAA